MISKHSFLYILSSVLFAQIVNISPAYTQQNPGVIPGNTGVIPGNTGDTSGKVAVERVDVHYVSETELATLVDNLLQGTVPSGDDTNSNGTNKKQVYAYTSTGIPNVVFIRGPEEKRKDAHRIIALVDLPRPSVKMELWGIQLTGDNPKKLTDASNKIRSEVDQTQAAIKGTFYRLQGIVGQATQNFQYSKFYTLLNETQFSPDFLNGSQEYSLSEMILRLIALGDSGDNVNAMNRKYPTNSFEANRFVARELSKQWATNDLHSDNVSKFTKVYRKSIEDIDFNALDTSSINWSEIYIPDLGVQPFERFFQLMGVRPLCQLNPANHEKLLCDWVPARLSAKEALRKYTCTPDIDEGILDCISKEPKEPKKLRSVESQEPRNSKGDIDSNCVDLDHYQTYSDQNACRLRNQVKNFGSAYLSSRNSPTSFNGKALAGAADRLNSPLEVLTRAINLDVEKFFIDPVLRRTEKIASGYGGIQYSNVGRASISTINGSESTLVAQTSSVFDVTPSPTLSQLLTQKTTLDGQVKEFFPEEAGVALKALITGLGGVVTLPQVISLIGAFGEQPRVLRELYSGINMKITPIVSRNLRSAELKINLVIPDPATQGSKDSDPSNPPTPPSPTAANDADARTKPFSRITYQQVNTRIYTDAIDFFAFSTFNNQTTRPGERFVVPVLGHVWKGIFGSIPIFGNLFQFPTGNRKVYSESILMTTTFITPTPYGLAGLLDERPQNNGNQKGSENVGLPSSSNLGNPNNR